MPLARQPESLLLWEVFGHPAPHVSGKVMVCGHTQQREGRPLNVGHAVCLDTWAYGLGWLTCLDMASDTLIQQVLGHGIAAKLSQRLGEGVLNGLLTARLGLAAIDVTRPLPFTVLPRPALGDLAKDLLRKRGDED